MASLRNVVSSWRLSSTERKVARLKAGGRNHSASQGAAPRHILREELLNHQLLVTYYETNFGIIYGNLIVCLSKFLINDNNFKIPVLLSVRNEITNLPVVVTLKIIYHRHRQSCFWLLFWFDEHLIVWSLDLICS